MEKKEFILSKIVYIMIIMLTVNLFLTGCLSADKASPDSDALFFAEAEFGEVSDTREEVFKVDSDSSVSISTDITLEAGSIRVEINSSEGENIYQEDFSGTAKVVEDVIIKEGSYICVITFEDAKDGNINIIGRINEE